MNATETEIELYNSLKEYCMKNRCWPKESFDSHGGVSVRSFKPVELSNFSYNGKDFVMENMRKYIRVDCGEARKNYLLSVKIWDRLWTIFEVSSSCDTYGRFFNIGQLFESREELELYLKIKDDEERKDIYRELLGKKCR